MSLDEFDEQIDEYEKMKNSIRMRDLVRECGENLIRKEYGTLIEQLNDSQITYPNVPFITLCDDLLMEREVNGDESMVELYEQTFIDIYPQYLNINVVYVGIQYLMNFQKDILDIVVWFLLMGDWIY